MSREPGNADPAPTPPVPEEGAVPLAGADAETLRAAVARGDFDAAPQTPGQMFTRRRRGQGTVEILPYDFKRPERIGKDQMRALYTLHEAFARSFGAGLSGLLRTIVEIGVSSCEQISYAEFIARLPNPTSLNLLPCRPLEGHFLLEVSPEVIYPVIDRLLGGTNRDVVIPQRPMTPIETRLVQKLLERALLALGEAWAGVQRLDLSLGEMENNPQLVQVVPPNEVVVAIIFDVRLGTRCGPMRLCLPYNSIEPLMDRLNSQSWLAAGRARRGNDAETRLARTVGGATVALDAVLAHTTMTLSELRGLEVGDLVVTTRRASEPAILRVEGKAKFVARLGQHRGRRALQLMRATAPVDPVLGPAPSSST
ncbi:MAG: flagellar motor switch protein FliM [Phycisphaerales bacterium]